MQTANKKVVNSWAMYDWANSVYSLVITSTIFPAYFEEVARNNPNTKDVTFLGRTFNNSSLNTYALGIAFLVVAIMSPILSSIADSRGNKKSFLRFFMTMGSISCSCLYFFKDISTLTIGIIAMMVACVGYWSSLVFYNSYLPEIAAPEDRDRISAKGFSMGYIGSMILQIACFVFVLMPEKFGVTTGGASRFSFLLVGIWWFVFGTLALKNFPKSTPVEDKNKGNSFIKDGYKELAKVWQQIKQLPLLKKFLFSFFFYNMGVQTVILAATLYGKGELNIPTTNLIVAILLIQILAIPGAFAMSKLSEKIGNFKTLMIVVALWIIVCIVGYFLPKDGANEFYGLAVLVGFIMGGIQSLSRSTYSKLMPETHDTTSFFSFYDVTEKIAIVIGMFSFGYITEMTGSQRNSVLFLVLFFIMGLIGLFVAQKATKTNS